MLIIPSPYCLFIYLGIGVVEPLVVRLPEVNDIDVGLVHGLDVSHLGVDAHRHSAINSGHGNAISGLNTVNLPYVKIRDLTVVSEPVKTGFVEKTI